MKRIFLFIAAGVVFFGAVARLPAPIQEVTESPTPAPEHSATAKSKQTAKHKIAKENSDDLAKHTPAQSVKQTPAPQRQLTGTWSGKLTVSGILAVGRDNTFVINREQTSVRWNTVNYPVVANGSSISWKAGSFSELNCKLTMAGNGNTAEVRITSIWGNAVGTVNRQE
jgi:hypothetical protein